MLTDEFHHKDFKDIPWFFGHGCLQCLCDIHNRMHSELHSFWAEDAQQFDP